MKRLLTFFCAVLSAASRLSAQDITTGLVSHYPLTEKTGTVAADSVAGRHGTLIGGPVWLDPGLRFNGGAQYVRTPQESAAGISNSLTVAFWVRVDSNYLFQWLVAKGVQSDPGVFNIYLRDSALNLDWNRPGVSGGNGYNVWETSVGLGGGVWRHVAVIFSSSGIRVFVDGNQAAFNGTAVTFGTNSAGLTLGWASGFDDFGLRGALRDVRIYTRALAAADILKLVNTLPPGFEGLWVGSASLNEVKEAATGAWSAAPAFSEQVLMHVDESGAMRLLKEATLMQTREATPRQIVVTRPEFIPTLDGVTQRGGRRIGQRYSSATFPLPDDQVALTKNGSSFTTSIALAAGDPVNPFRHKYHPDLANGRTLSRTTSFSFTPGDSPSDHTLTGTLTESFTGLHKTTLEARGPVTFTRVSTSGKLNQP